MSGQAYGARQSNVAAWSSLRWTCGGRRVVTLSDMQPIGDRGPIAAVAVAAVALAMVEQLAATGPTTGDVLAAAPLTVAGAGGSVLLAPARPLPALTLFVAAYAGQVAVTGWVDSVVALVLWCGLLGLAARRTSTRAAALAAVIGAVPVLVFVLGREDRDAGDIGPSTVALWLLPWLTGRVLRARHRRHQQELRLLRSEAERKEAQERADSADRRAALARDMHDVLGHTLTSLVVQARSARASLTTDPDLARHALDEVENAGRAAMAELRSLVTGFASSVPVVAEEPGLADLTTLTTRLPLEVRTEVDPASLELPGPVQAAGYRVIQEALTNTVRHSRAETADLEVRLDEARALLLIEVRDPGPAAGEPLSGAGTGVSGMRARIRDLGGHFEAGAVDAGFRVRAELPTEGPR